MYIDGKRLTSDIYGKEKIKDKHFSFIRFFQNTSAFGYRIYLAIIIAIVALLGIIRLITYLIRRQREKKMNIN